MGTTLRDALESAVENEELKLGGTEPAPAEAAPEAPQAAPEAAETAEQKAGRTAGRPRDANGRLLPGKPQRDSAAESGKASPASTPNAQTVQAAPAAEAVLAPIPRPSSWKKEMWPVWDKLNKGEPLSKQEARQLAEYNVERESQAVKGVSTYKAEYDRLKPLGEAMNELTPALQQHGVDPATWLREVGNTHRMLAQGTNEQKLGMIVKLAQGYNIPLQNLFVQGQDGRLYLNPQAQAPQAQRQQAQQPDLSKLIDQKLSERAVAQTIAQFEAEVPTKYPHYQDVKQTMVGLLQAELATDLEDAYQQALKHPRHSDIYASIQEQETKARAEREAQEKAKQVARARSQAVSPRSSTPTASGADKPKGIRGHLEVAVDQVAGDGRV